MKLTRMALQNRKDVLAQIEEIGHEFVRRVAQDKEGHNHRLIKDAICRVFTYGSYRLGVHSPGSDIDTLLVAPNYCKLEDFFKHMPDCLNELAPPGAITSFAAVPDAFVPIIKMVYSGIEIDLIFASMATLRQLPSEPTWNMQDSNLLRGLNENEVRAVNGTRVNDQIIALVPEPATFRVALRAIKQWAQSRAVYGNIVGFPGGIAWALMVARVCQLLPKAPSSVVVAKLFEIMRQWPWPQPVILKDVESGNLPLPIWNPKVSRRDATALMPVLTPAYPSMNSTYNITNSTFAIIKRELQRGAQIASSIIEGTRPWKDLFEKHTFFTKDYPLYLQVLTSAKDKMSLKEWSGWVESRLRTLIQAMDRQKAILVAQPYVKNFSQTHRVRTQEDALAVSNGSTGFVVEADENEEGEQVPSMEGSHIYSKVFYIGIEPSPKVDGVDVSEACSQFKAKCEEWEPYVHTLQRKVGFGINTFKPWTLPADVFGEGEERPSRATGNRVTKPKKRAAPDSDYDDYDYETSSEIPAAKRIRQ